MLDTDSLPAQFAAIHLPDSSGGGAGGLELDKGESALEGDLPRAAVGLEELLNVALADRRGDIPEEHAEKFMLNYSILSV